MAPIRGVGGGTTIRGGRAPRGAGGGFHLGAGVAESGATEAAERPAAASAIGLLALQETAPAAERDARAHRRGEAMLRELAALQRDLLAGRSDPARLHSLLELTTGEAAADPVLRDAVAAIALRVRIELARRQTAAFLSPD
ncbi:flagellar assembly protein FliX [Roseomonas sp. CECT 9278]|uniref:flagellar assembly protein FliX n=1 Tax=Roseomonas sp. CECT 9278 TaxID=2845823 RepID=UPI001E59C81A|nr:flagellar assembly protein FliX [Roseomonas sp. CECT 9278]CAH0141706.1 hypothetical protein ROS9278_00498 [Roseomonas sp. CECT 9278]